ncbi:unnamed protein product [Amoebophrya sp. A25]|nr:unnamed protein product [Amoebophrya sp. A25]|eukprot:GSA25T00003183001.1
MTVTSASSSSARAATQRAVYHWGPSETSWYSRWKKMSPPKRIMTLSGDESARCLSLGKEHGGFLVTPSSSSTGGDLFTFGKSQYPVLGRKAEGEDKLEPKKVPYEGKLRDFSCGGFHSAAVDEEARLCTWGWHGSFLGGANALGFEAAADVSEPTRVPLPDGEKVKQVVCGERHTVVLAQSGKVFTTGSGEYGLLGLGDVSDSTELELVEHYPDSVFQTHIGADEIVKVSVGLHHSAALTAKGELFCWGQNDQGQCGVDESMGDNFSFEPFPRLVRSLATQGFVVRDVACGDTHTDVVTTCGKVITWGNRAWLSPHRISRSAEAEKDADQKTHKTPPSEADNDEIFAEDRDEVTKLAGGARFSLLLTKNGSLFAYGRQSGCLPKDLVQPTRILPEWGTGTNDGSNTAARVLDVAASREGCLVLVEETVD